MGRLKIWVAASLAALALLAAGCTPAGSGGKQQEGASAGAGGADAAQKDGTGTKGMDGMMGGGMSKDGMGNMGNMGNMGGMGGTMGGGMMGGGDAKHEEEKYEPPTKEQLARVTRTVTIDLTDFAINPKDVTVKKGEVVKFVVRNKGKLPHDWMADGIDALDTHEFGPGEERVLVWEADRTGTFPTYCMVPGHKEAGMTGTLKITG